MLDMQIAGTDTAHGYSHDGIVFIYQDRFLLFGEAKDLGLSFYIGLAFIALSVGLQTWSVMRIQKRVAALDKLAAEDSDKKPHPVFIEPIGSRKERE